MSTKKLSNIPLKKYRKFLEACELKKIKSSKGRGGHEKWVKKELDRPIILQSHIDPVPEFIIKQHLRNMSMTKEDFFKIYDEL